MQLFNIFQKAQKQREDQLLKEFEEGRVLIVDGETDNKQHFKEIKEIKEDEESTS